MRARTLARLWFGFRTTSRFLLLCSLALLAFCGCSRRIPNGVLAPGEPTQTALLDAPSIDRKGFKLTPLAHFEVTARVLSAKRYRFDREARLARVDLALGWGPMSNSGVLEDLQIHQAARAYFWSAREMPLERELLESHSANMHLIGADSDVERRLRRVRKDDVITLQGSLVQVEARDGWKWTSSLSRTDTGDGACEVVLVDSLAVQ